METALNFFALAASEPESYSDSQPLPHRLSTSNIKILNVLTMPSLLFHSLVWAQNAGPTFDIITRARYNLVK
jgi:hypothetical protein